MSDILIFLFDSEYVLTLFISLSVFAVHLKKRKFYYLTLIGSFILCELVWYFRPSQEVYYYIPVLTIFGLLLLLAFKINFFQLLFLFANTYCLQHLVFKITISLVFAFGGNPIWHSWWYFLIYILTALIVSCIIYFIFGKKIAKEGDIHVNSITILLTTIIIIFAAIFLSYDSQNRLLSNLNNNLEGTQFILFMDFNIYGMIVSLLGIAMLFFNASSVLLQDENDTLELLLKKDEERYNIAKINYEKLNIKIHDLKHLIHNENIDDEARKDIEKVASNAEAIYYTGNKALDIVLSEKNTICNSKNIDLLVIAEGKQLQIFKSYEIYSLFGNLIDNAIESLEKVDNPDLKVIKIKIETYKNNLLIIAENYTSIVPNIINGMPQTIKSDKNSHGFGTKSIRSIIENYGGYFKISVEKNIFQAKAIVPLKTNKESI